MGPSSSYSDSGPEGLRAWDAPVLRTRADRSRVSRFRAAKQSSYYSRVLETASMAGTGGLAEVTRCNPDSNSEQTEPWKILRFVALKAHIIHV